MRVQKGRRPWIVWHPHFLGTWCVQKGFDFWETIPCLSDLLCSPMQSAMRHCHLALLVFVLWTSLVAGAPLPQHNSNTQTLESTTFPETFNTDVLWRTNAGSLSSGTFDVQDAKQNGLVPGGERCVVCPWMIIMPLLITYGLQQ